MLVTGGGAFNKFLMGLMQKQLSCKIYIPSDEIVAFKEALIFAFLGLLRYRDEINVLNSVTGARNNTVSGALYSGKKSG